MKTKIIEKLQEYTYFIWLILLIFIAVFVTYFYDTNKKNQIYFLQKSFDNVYLKKSLTSLTAEFKPRYVSIDYKVQSGDTCLLYTSPSPRDMRRSRMPSSA